MSQRDFVASPVWWEKGKNTHIHTTRDFQSLCNQPPLQTFANPSPVTNTNQTPHRTHSLEAVRNAVTQYENCWKGFIGIWPVGFNQSGWMGIIWGSFYRRNSGPFWKPPSPQYNGDIRRSVSPTLLHGHLWQPTGRVAGVVVGREPIKESTV